MDNLKTIALNVLAGIITVGIVALRDPICRWVIIMASIWVPDDERNSIREEWLAHLNEVDGFLGKLGHALSCALCVIKLRNELIDRMPSSQAETTQTRPDGGIFAWAKLAILILSRYRPIWFGRGWAVAMSLLWLISMPARDCQESCV